jgi:hypothetical protein
MAAMSKSPTIFTLSPPNVLHFGTHRWVTSAHIDWFIEFMKEELGLEIRNNPAQSTTLGGSAIDHIFTRRLSHLKSVNYANYFSYHKPRLTITET